MDEGFYRRHDAMSDPGDRVGLLDGLPADVPSLIAVVQGVLLHDFHGGTLYGAPPAGFAEASRETLPVARRLAAIVAKDGAPLDRMRAPFDRSIGTCRDFALLLTALLRHNGVAARVRCGFADYFGDSGWEDHWVCERWIAEEGRWALADAQLDAAHRDHLGIDFDSADVPRRHFRLAPEAWQDCRGGGDPASYGHGEARGLWFVEVNVARDLLALTGEPTSPWDTWRSARGACREADAVCLAWTDRCAALALAAGGLEPPQPKGADRMILATPFWQAQG